VARIEPAFEGHRETLGWREILKILTSQGLQTITTDEVRSAEVPFFVFDAEDETAVKSACNADEDDGGLPRSIGNATLDTYDIDERINARTWKVIAHYKCPDWQPVMDPDGRFSFDTGGGTQHVTQSLATVGRYGPKATTKLQGAIGFDGKNVQGVDITVPVFNFTETHWFRNDQVTQAYKLLLFRKTGKYNTDAFRGFAPGEVLFLGAAGDRQGDDPDDRWELTFKFAAMPNRSNFQVGGITVASKLGWEYLWVQYDDEADDDKKQVIKKPVAVYVERVYEGTPFSQLGIG